MRYLLMVAMMSLGVTAFANDNNATMERRLKGQHDVKFECGFHTRHKKGVRCEAKGEVCVNFGGPVVNGTDERRCDRDRDDNRIVVRCGKGKGWEVDGRAFSRIVSEQDRGEDLFIFSKGDRDDHHRSALIEVEEFERFDGDKDRDDVLPASLKFSDGDNDRDDHRKLYGQCRFELERENGPRL